jgi:acetylornithine deacetylase/succinyl-diaminopimelate desuccinylase-like protein
MLNDKDIARMTEDMKRHLVNLIRIDTTNPPGNETPACEYVRDELRKAGIEGEIFEAAPGRGNFVCRIKGDGSKRPMAVASHLDVVMAEREHWTVDPFAGIEKDGFIWGRGALDMKFFTAMQMVVMAELKRRGAPLKRDVIMLAVADEEQISLYGMDWMVRNHFDKIDCEFQINEGAGMAIPLGGKNVYFCQTAEKGVCWYRIKTKGEAGHGSVPRADNSVVRMARAIVIAAKKRPARKTEVVARIINELSAKALPGIQGFAFKQLFTPGLSEIILSAIRGQNKDIAETISAMMRDTVSPTIFHAGVKENVIPSESEAILDCRILPGMTADKFRKILQDELGVDEVSLVHDAVPNPTESPVDSDLYRSIERVVAKNDPNGVVVPLLMTGATDSRFLREKGIVAYGFSPFRSEIHPDQYLTTFHGHNERIPVDGFGIGISMFHDLILDLCA